MDQLITVPETTLPNGTVVPAFQVGQFACSKSEDSKLAITAEGAPWVSINYHEAREVCAAAGYSLITERQWLAIAVDAARQDCNWTKGKAGEGKLFRGLRKGNVSSAQPGDYQPQDEKERRWLTLSNGERICDLNGNVWQWVFDDVQGDENGLTTIIEADSPSLAAAPYPSEKKGMGWRPDGRCDWSGNALVRGGYWCSGSNAGAFRLSRGWPDDRYYNVGFRCTKPVGL
jgi:formylglycine-generating enzyme required for sulfatase activity